MNEQALLKQKNQQWQEDDKRWQKDIDDWQRETKRLIAFLYMMEKALPEHSSKLEQHKQRIDKHNDELTRYQCGLDEHCLPSCPSHIDITKQRVLHKKMEKLHQSMAEEHEQFSIDYLQKMQIFRELTQRLMDELDVLEN
ncbi:hypothetical protein [Methylophaga sp.]|uniref:hypothetical protein n=1 Tax=Methylophaga sp. TaxID=2024840 RepID=UPI003F69FDFA